jgi:hypothetical protein
MARAHRHIRRFVLVILSFVVALGIASPLAVRANAPTSTVAPHPVVTPTVSPTFPMLCDAQCRQALSNSIGANTLTLHARDVTSHYWYHESLSGVYCVPEGPAVSNGAPYDYNALKAAGEIVEGYRDWYKPGTDPFPCEEVDDIYYRGAVNFDLGAIRQFAKAHNFQHATLSFQIDQTNASYDVTYCLAHLEGNALAWNGIDLGKDSPLESGFALNGDHIEADVASTVVWAVLSDSDDLNFLFVGSQEGFPKDNDRCSTTYRNFTLTLTP